MTGGGSRQQRALLPRLGSVLLEGALCCVLGGSSGCDAGARPPAHVGAPEQAAGARSAAGQRASAQQPRLLEPCVPANYEICFNALDDNCNGAIDEGCGTPGGVVQFMIAWDVPHADVDLNVTDPNGELIEAGRTVQSGLLKSRDCPGRRQECAGVNFENVFLQGSKAPTLGTYRVSVSLESLAGDEPPIWVTLSCRLGAKHYAYQLQLNEPTDEQHLELEL